MIKGAGTILLILGFAMLAIAVLIRDPLALDANIGAGILSLVGIPTGGLGVLLLLIAAVIGRRAVRE